MKAYRRKPGIIQNYRVGTPHTPDLPAISCSLRITIARQ
jgi:hypothetical protein